MAVKNANKFYNIDKAESLITIKKTFGKNYGENPDLDWTETLYKKPSGEFFVYGEGGKETPYSVDVNGEPTAGSRYEVWTDYNINQARNWVYTNCPEKMEMIFMKDEDDEKKSVTTITLSAKARKNLKRKAQENKETVSEIIRQWAETLY